MRKGQRSGLNDEVEDLVAVATDDKDQWASLIARALGGLKQRFDLQRLQQDVPAVSYSPDLERTLAREFRAQ
jgi:hypothetical protein